MKPRLSVLRLGHRMERDKRITSHLGLTARAFGADEIILSGEEDDTPLETWEAVSERFGGKLECRYEPKPMGWLRAFSKGGGTIVHLTMYGKPWREVSEKIPFDRPVAVVVGGTKVPGELFGIADYNVAVGNQPHSEVAALAVFLDTWRGELEPERFSDGLVEVLPSDSGKKIVSRED
ncbi:MAG: tRNA (cytidine(56)-2'-O)-methyltransferase [Euryarchaeota archaeon]|nr:tRNA (cytidine(56)-2'-O)-methyltransferase [Euryarchaeota archaeon]